jgi:hypothetical protein
MKSDPSPPDAAADAAGESAETLRPKVLGVRFGVNPNSSSLGVDVTFLLFGGTAAVAASLMLSAWLRGRRRKVELVGESPAPPLELPPEAVRP